jgi:hypothetical protein
MMLAEAFFYDNILDVKQMRKKVQSKREQRRDEEHARQLQGGGMADSQCMALPPELEALYRGGLASSSIRGESQTTVRLTPDQIITSPSSRLDFHAPCGPDGADWVGFLRECKDEAERTEVHRKQRTPGQRGNGTRPALRSHYSRTEDDEDDADMDSGGGARGRFVLMIGKLLAACNRHRDELAEFLQVIGKDCTSVFPWPSWHPLFGNRK